MHICNNNGFANERRSGSLSTSTEGTPMTDESYVEKVGPLAREYCPQEKVASGEVFQAARDIPLPP